MTSTEELASLLALLKAEGLLARTTEIYTPQGVRLLLAVAPEPISRVEKTEQEVGAQLAKEEREERIARAHVGGFRRPGLPR